MTVERGRSSSYRSYRSSSGSRFEYQKPLGEKVKDCCRWTIAFIFSNVGICGLMVGYTLMGSYLFNELEGKEPPDSKRQYYTVNRYLNKTVNHLWDITLDYNTFHKGNWTASVELVIKNLSKILIKNIELGYTGYDEEYGSHLQWGEEEGFLYALTVITTIGYGHIAPVKVEGRIATIFYAIFGMPVFLLYMANMGNILAKSLKWIYAKVFICRKSTPNQFDTQAVWRTADAILRGPASPNYIPSSNQSYSRGRRGALYHIPSTEYDNEDYNDYDREIPTISRLVDRETRFATSDYDDRGRGHLSQAERHYRDRREAAYQYSKPSCSNQRDERYGYRDRRYYDDNYRNSYRDRWDDEYRRSDLYSSEDDEYSYSTRDSDVVSLEMEHFKPEKLDLATVNIPIFVSLIIMGALLVGGMMLFKVYENTWSYVTSFYFCFISLTTIGFGDFVPGASLDKKGKDGFIYCSLYLMVGLALLSMCFNLMQEEVVQAVTKCLKAIRATKQKDQE